MIKIYSGSQKAIFHARKERQQKKGREGRAAKSEAVRLRNGVQHTRRNSFNSENCFFCSSCIVCFAIRCRNAIGARPKFSLCYSVVLCMDDEGGRNACQEKLLHFLILFFALNAAVFCLKLNLFASAMTFYLYLQTKQQQIFPKSKYEKCLARICNAI